MRLAIISHTEHYQLADGTIVGWGPTITEINHLLELFEEIYHVAMLNEEVAPASALPYVSDNIIFVPIPKSGGTSLLSKMDILIKAPKVITIVSSVLKKVDVFQMRTPTGIGVYLIPYLTLCKATDGWYKYAGNWNQQNAPLGYAFQRWLLKNQRRTVTINGHWKDQPQHCVTFENPCLTSEDIEHGLQISQQKTLKGTLSFCFVGRLESEKGVERIIRAFQQLDATEKARVDCVHFVGDGSDMEVFKALSADSGVRFKFHGFLNRTETHAIYQKCHVFLLPTTASEGFPKVIAEAMNYGCIPIVSDISSIGQYVLHGLNGIVIDPVSVDTLLSNIRRVLKMENATFEDYKALQREQIAKFTFDAYHYKIKKYILKTLES